MEDILSSSVSGSSSTDNDLIKEENFLESLTSQVDEENINDIIIIQKKSYLFFKCSILNSYKI